MHAALAPIGTLTGPGLEPDRSDQPLHLVISGENEHVLRLLARDHAGQVDLIYADPPYNTGSQTWIYHDDCAGSSSPDGSGTEAEGSHHSA